MSATLETLPRAAIPPEVQQFAIEKGVSRYLNAVIDVAGQAFPLSPLNVSVACDSEDEAQRYIAIDVDVSGQNSEQLLSGQQIWSAGIGRVCPSRYAVYFVLGWR